MAVVISPFSRYDVINQRLYLQAYKSETLGQVIKTNNRIFSVQLCPQNQRHHHQLLPRRRERPDCLSPADGTLLRIMESELLQSFWLGDAVSTSNINQISFLFFVCTDGSKAAAHVPPKIPSFPRTRLFFAICRVGSSAFGLFILFKNSFGRCRPCTWRSYFFGRLIM